MGLKCLFYITWKLWYCLESTPKSLNDYFAATFNTNWSGYSLFQSKATQPHRGDPTYIKECKVPQNKITHTCTRSRQSSCERDGWMGTYLCFTILSAILLLSIDSISSENMEYNWAVLNFSNSEFGTFSHRSERAFERDVKEK